MCVLYIMCEQKYFDGGMTDNLPTFEDDRTVHVSPFDGGQEICPQDAGSGRQMYMTLFNQSFRINLNNAVRGLHSFWPPPQDVLETYHLQGIADAKRFLRDEGFYEDSDEVQEFPTDGELPRRRELPRKRESKDLGEGAGSADLREKIGTANWQGQSCYDVLADLAEVIQLNLQKHQDSGGIRSNHCTSETDTTTSE